MNLDKSRFFENWKIFDKEVSDENWNVSASLNEKYYLKFSILYYISVL